MFKNKYETTIIYKSTCEAPVMSNIQYEYVLSDTYLIIYNYLWSACVFDKYCE
jgi:hypothetical protein